MKDYGYKALAASRGFRSIGLIIVNISFPLYLYALHLDLVSIGIVIFATVIFGMFVVMLGGAIGDRYGYKKSLLISELISFAGILLLACSTSIYLIVAAIVLGGLSGGGGTARGTFSNGLMPFIANNWKDEKERVKRMSLLMLLGGIGSVAGAVVVSMHSYFASFIGTTLSYRLIFSVSAALLFASLVSLLFIYEEKRPKKTTAIMKRTSLKYILKISAANSLSGAGIGMSMPILPLWFELAFGIGASYVGMIYIVYYLMGMLGSYLARVISFKHNLVNVVVATRISNGLLLVAMALSPIPIIASILYALRGLAASFGSPARSAVGVRGVDAEDYGTATSVQGIATRASQMTSGASGYLMDVALPLPLFLGGILQAASGVAYKKLIK